MDKEIQFSGSVAEFIQFAQSLMASTPGKPSGGPPDGLQGMGPFTTVDERCRERWPRATRKQKRRIRDACLGKYRQEVNRDPYKATGHNNGNYIIEMEYVAILDRAIDEVRNDEDERRDMPLFRQPRR
jgi:hypothetical protein